MDIAAVLREALAEKEWTVATLAERVGVSRRAATYWLSGQQLPTRAHRRVLARKLGLAPADLGL